MFYDRFVELCKGKKVSASRAALEIGLNKSTGELDLVALAIVVADAADKGQRAVIGHYAHFAIAGGQGGAVHGETLDELLRLLDVARGALVLTGDFVGEQVLWISHVDIIIELRVSAFGKPILVHILPFLPS